MRQQLAAVGPVEKICKESAHLSNDRSLRSAWMTLINFVLIAVFVIISSDSASKMIHWF